MVSIWMPDAPPASPGADDDEFADASGGVPSGWTEVDFDTNLTVDEDEAGLELIKTTQASPGSTAGIYKSIPAGDFTIWTKVDILSLSLTSTVTIGLALWQDATSSTGDLYILRLVSDATQCGVQLVTQTAYNSSTSSVTFAAISVDSMPTSIYLRVRRTSTTYAWDFSSDGIGWQRLNSGTISFTPTHYGPVVNNNNTGATLAARFAFFRYVASDVGITGLMSGDRITVVPA